MPSFGAHFGMLLSIFHHFCLFTFVIWQKSKIVYHQGVEYWADCAPPLEKFDTSPEVVYICDIYCVKIFQKVSLSFPIFWRSIGCPNVANSQVDEKAKSPKNRVLASTPCYSLCAGLSSGTKLAITLKKFHIPFKPQILGFQSLYRDQAELTHLCPQVRFCTFFRKKLKVIRFWRYFFIWSSEGFMCKKF